MLFLWLKTRAFDSPIVSTRCRICQVFGVDEVSVAYLAAQLSTNTMECQVVYQTDGRAHARLFLNFLCMHRVGSTVRVLLAGVFQD
jgi:hypothetical protein